MSPTVWTPTGTTAQNVFTYQCSGTGTCTCGSCQQAISIIEPPAIVLTNQTNAIPPISYHFNQLTSSNTWIIAHGLNFYPNVTVVDSAGTIVEGEIHYTDSNNLTLTFTSAFSGSAYLS
jgi:hypothetical protein